MIQRQRLQRCMIDKVLAAVVIVWTGSRDISIPHCLYRGESHGCAKLLMRIVLELEWVCCKTGLRSRKITTDI